MAIINNRNAFNSVRGVLSLFSPLNKGKKGIDEDDQSGEILPEFESSLTNEEINRMTAMWIASYESYAKDIKSQQKDNVNYWIGKHYNDLTTAGVKRPLVDNLIFEAVETFLPIATRATPEANVAMVNGQQSQLSKTLQPILNYKGKETMMRMKLKGVTRDWVLYLIGCMKTVWDTQKNDFDIKKVLPSRLILDPTAEIEVNGTYYGEYLGEKRKTTARKLAKMFPASKGYIETYVQGNWGTKITYIEWWTNWDVFFTLDSHILGKFKNPHWNYDGEIEKIDPLTGKTTKQFVKGKNHFPAPRIPYSFLTIFNLGKQPHDETSLITQNIPLQDTINKRYQQIDKNVESQNNGIVLSGKYFTKEQAAEAATQLSRGNPLWVPEGDIRASYARDQAPQLAADVFNHLRDARNELRNIFGTSGSSPEGTKQQESVRGKILINQLDSSRIGGGVTEYIELFSETLYNWFVQMIYVYYVDERLFPIGLDRNKDEVVKIVNTDFEQPVSVTVKSGSLVPKDPLTQRNEAMDLWSAQAIDPISFYEKLDFPNPYESAKDLLTWRMVEQGKLPPQAMFKDFEMPATPGAMPTDQPTGIVSGSEDNLSEQPTESVGIQSKQLMSSVPLQ